MPVKLGQGGVLKVMEIALNAEEKAALDKSAEAVRGLVKTLGELGF